MRVHISSLVVAATPTVVEVAKWRMGLEAGDRRPGQIVDGGMREMMHEAKEGRAAAAKQTGQEYAAAAVRGKGVAARGKGDHRLLELRRKLQQAEQRGLGAAEVTKLRAQVVTTADDTEFLTIADPAAHVPQGTLRELLRVCNQMNLPPVTTTCGWGDSTGPMQQSCSPVHLSACKDTVILFAPRMWQQRGCNIRAADQPQMLAAYAAKALRLSALNKLQLQAVVVVAGQNNPGESHFERWHDTTLPQDKVLELERLLAGRQVTESEAAALTEQVSEQTGKLPEGRAKAVGSQVLRHVAVLREHQALQEDGAAVDAQHEEVSAFVEERAKSVEKAARTGILGDQILDSPEVRDLTVQGDAIAAAQKLLACERAGQVQAEIDAKFGTNRERAFDFFDAKKRDEMDPSPSSPPQLSPSSSKTPARALQLDDDSPEPVQGNDDRHAQGQHGGRQKGPSSQTEKEKEQKPAAKQSPSSRSLCPFCSWTGKGDPTPQSTATHVAYKHGKSPMGPQQATKAEWEKKRKWAEGEVKKNMTKLGLGDLPWHIGGVPCGPGFGIRDCVLQFGIHCGVHCGIPGSTGGAAGGCPHHLPFSLAGLRPLRWVDAQLGRDGG
eukprot:gene17348-2529_t